MRRGTRSFLVICGSDYLHLKYWILFWCKWCSSDRGPTPWQSYCWTKDMEFPPFLCVPEPTYQFNNQPASEAAMGYMRTPPCFWHGEAALMRSLCMLFEKHAPPLMMRLALSLSLPTQRNVAQRKRVSPGVNRRRKTPSLFVPMRKAFSFCNMLTTETQRNEHSSAAKWK